MLDGGLWRIRRGVETVEYKDFLLGQKRTQKGVIYLSIPSVFEPKSPLFVALCIESRDNPHLAWFSLADLWTYKTTFLSNVLSSLVLLLLHCLSPAGSFASLLGDTRILHCIVLLIATIGLCLSRISRSLHFLSQ